MLRSLLCDEHGHFLVVEDADTISDIIARKDRHLWLDLEKPSEEEFHLIKQEFELHPLAVEDAMLRHQRPKVDQYTHFYFVVFYAVSAVDPNGTITPRTGDVAVTGRRGLRGTRFHHPSDAPPPDQAPAGDDATSGPIIERISVREISMFLGENYLITVHEDPIPEFDEVARRWYRNAHDIASQIKFKRRPQGTRELTPGEEAAFIPPPEDFERPTSNQKQTMPRLGDMGIGRLMTLGSFARSQQDKSGDANALDQLPHESVKNQARAGGEQNGKQATGMGVLLYSLLDTIVDSYFPLIDHIVDRVEDLEEQIFERFSSNALQSVFTLKKDLLLMRKVLAPERDVLNVLTRRDLPIFDEHTIVYFQDVYDHIVRITDSIDTYRDLLSSALDSYLSMQSNRLNITVQTLTSLSIIMMSIAAFTGWYGMNFQNMPELHTTWGYPVLIVIVAVVVLLELAFFKRKRWL